MIQIVPGSSGKIGNTSQSSPAKHYCFTLNNYNKNELDDLLELCNSSKVLKYSFQEEMSKSGTPHLQGYIEFKDKVRPKNLASQKIHWEKSRNIQASIDYTMKDDTRNGNIYTNIAKKRTMKLIEIELKDWQKELYEIYKNEPDNRTIHWIYDNNGCGGKTTLAKWLLQRHNDITYISATKSADILTCVNDTSKLFIIDIPRCSGEFCPYNALEQIKNGLVCDSKLKKESRQLMFEPPHIFVFSNHMYDKNKLSKDRMKLITI